MRLISRLRRFGRFGRHVRISGLALFPVLLDRLELRRRAGQHILVSDHATGFPPLAVRSLTPLVLIVDDEPDQVEMYQLALKLSGFDVMAASTGTDAISRARAARPAVIVLDLRLPDMTGWDVCGALKTDSLTEQIPIILLTAAVTSTLPQEARAAGCAEYLLKPCFPDHLARTVREVIATHQQA